MATGKDTKDTGKDTKGTAKTQVEIYSNYHKITSRSKCKIYQHHVDFYPEIDSKKIRFKIIEQIIGLNQQFAFDGRALFLTTKYNNKTVNHLENDIEYKINITFKKEIEKLEKIDINDKREREIYISEITRFLNIIFNRCLIACEFERLGRKRAFFHPEKINFNDYKFKIAKGYQTAIGLFNENDFYLTSDIANKIISNDTIMDIINFYSGNKNKLIETVVNNVAMTTYNNRLYKIDDIAWEKTPLSTFETLNGPVTFVDYYKQNYNIEIKNLKQPLLMSLPTERDKRAGRKQPIYLVPEICALTGPVVTDDLKLDSRAKKKLDEITKTKPRERCKNLFGLINTIKTNRESKAILDKWNLNISSDLSKIDANLLIMPTIVFGNKILKTDNLSLSLKDSKHLSTIPLKNWIIIFQPRDRNETKDFVKKLLEVSKPMDFQINEPEYYILSETSVYTDGLRCALNKKKYQLAICVTPSKSKTTYDIIKKICLLEFQIPCQVIVSKTLKYKDSILTSVVTKIAIQLSAKLGGEIWGAHIPIRDVMFVGLDVFHHKNKPSVVGFVASLNRPTKMVIEDLDTKKNDITLGCTKWYSRSIAQPKGQEYIDSLQIFFGDALVKYRGLNGILPERIIVYRDGVSDGQFDIIKDHEIDQIKSAFKIIDNNYNPKFVFIIVQKTGIARFFSKSEHEMVNPSIGTCIDKTVVKNENKEFYLISQKSIHGTVKPTHYHIIEDTYGLSLDQYEKLAFILTQVYYNWPGNIRVPAPCLYAHKLAYLHGNTLNENLSSGDLQTKLCFL